MFKMRNFTIVCNLIFNAIVIAAVCGFALSWWNTGSLGGSICCSKTFIYISECIVPSKTCKLSILYARMHPHTIRDAGFWTERWWHARRSPFPSSLARRTWHPWFPTRMLHLDSSEHWTFSTLKQSILNVPWPTGHGSASWPCSHMAFFLHDRALVGICTWHADCVYRQWFLEVFLGPFSNVNDRIMPMSDAVLSEGPKTTCIQQRSSVLSLKHRDFSRNFWWCYAL